MTADSDNLTAADALRQKVAAALAQAGIVTENIGSMGNADQYDYDWDTTNKLLVGLVERHVVIHTDTGECSASPDAGQCPTCGSAFCIGRLSYEDCHADVFVDEASARLRVLVPVYEAAKAYVAVRDHDDIEGAEAVLGYASEEWRAFAALRAALGEPA